MQISKILIAGAVIVGSYFVATQFKTASSSKDQLAVSLPQLDATGVAGQSLFAENCQACHGTNGAGTDQGPPLIHQIYRPGHHGDQAFVMAARYGVRSHHWPYGNMPKQPQVSQQDMEKIVRFVRQVQRANGVN